MTDPNVFKKWDKATQERALAMLKARDGSTYKPFYCPNPKCDGDAHGTDDGWDHNHARPDQRPPAWDGDWLTLLMMSGRGGGKMLRLSTPIPTPTGWTTMGDLKAGDTVFDENGNHCTVLIAHDYEMPERAYRLTFSDGSEIVAGGEHQWVTWTHRDRKAFNRNHPEEFLPENWPTWRQYRRSARGTGRLWPTGVGPSVRNTDEIVSTFRVGKRGDLNHSIPVAGALECKEASLPIDPYILGAWLGDGNKREGQFTTHVNDMPSLVDALNSAGYRTSSRVDVRRPSTMTVVAYGLRMELRDLGVLGNKHVPEVYLWASAEQRRSLLAGLLDTDGTADATKGLIEFCNTNKDLAEAVLFLARSLGQKPTLAEGVARLNGRTIGPKYRVTWRPTYHPFRLERKNARVRDLGAQGSRTMHRMIRDYEEIEPEMMRCITVNSPNSMYLAGEAMIPTHNTMAGSNITHGAAKRVKELGIVGTNLAEARTTMIEGPTGILATAPPDFRPVWEPSRRRLTWPNGCVGHVYTGEEPDRIRGSNLGFIWLDEAAFIDKIDEVWMNLLLTLREVVVGGNPHILITTTPRATKFMKELVKDERTVLHRVSTYANLKNLSSVFKDQVLSQFEGTRMGRQELYGEILEDVEGALWNTGMFTSIENPPAMSNIVVSVDPAGSANRRSDETGIIVVGIEGHGRDFRAYILEDATGKYTPKGWATKAIHLKDKWNARMIVAEKNYGGDMVKHTLRSVEEECPVTLVDSRKGKEIRATPIVGLYEQGRVLHAGMRGDFVDLEDEMTSWIPGESPSPNRIDAAVHGIKYLTDNRGGGKIHVPGVTGTRDEAKEQPFRPASRTEAAKTMTRRSTVAWRS